MTTPSNLEARVPSEEIHNDEQIDLGRSRSAVLPTKVSDGTDKNDNDLLQSNNENEQSQTLRSGPTLIILSPTASEKQKEIHKFTCSVILLLKQCYFTVKTLLTDFIF